MSWKRDMAQDERFIRFKKRMEGHWLQQIKVEDLRSEIESLHLNRRVADLRMGADKIVDTIIDVTVQDQNNRSRLCHIKLQINDVSSSVQEYVDRITQYLTVTYTDDLNEAGHRAKAAKTEAVQSMKTFQAVNQHLSQLNVLWENCDIVIHDIDQAGFVVKRVLDALNIHTARQVMV